MEYNRSQRVTGRKDRAVGGPNFTVDGEPVDELPGCSGVYRFYDDTGGLLYVGKSIDVRSRIRSHYCDAARQPRKSRIMQQVSLIDCQPTAGEVGALLLENEAIKRELPLFNRRQRRNRQLWTIEPSHCAEGFLQPRPSHFYCDGKMARDTFGLYHSRDHIESTLRGVARLHGLCLRRLGLERGRGPCFQYQIKRCDGACVGKQTAVEHNEKLLDALSEQRIAAWPYEGRVLLEERALNPLPCQPARQWHVIDQWSYLGTLGSLTDAAAPPSPGMRLPFDRDSYRIIYKAVQGGLVSLLDTTGLPMNPGKPSPMEAVPRRGGGRYQS